MKRLGAISSGVWRFCLCVSRAAPLAIVLVAVTFVTTAADAQVSVSVTPAQPLMDQRLEIVVSRLAPGKPFRVTAEMRAQDGLWWRSAATFVSDARGTIDLGSQAPRSGSYRATDGMGLVWSMLPDREPRTADHAFFTITDFSQPITTELQVRDGERLLASAKIVRRYAGSGVRKISANDGVTGTLYLPNDGAAHPGILVIGGSDGGAGAPGTAMMFAAHGFAALSVAYFGEDGLPSSLEGISMDYFSGALRWLRHQPGIDPRFVAIYGESRGTEPALWTAATADGVDAVIVRSPSFVLWGGVTSNHLPGGPAWTRYGKPLPYIANRISLDFGARYLWDRITGTPVRQTLLFLENLRDAGDTGPAEIPVEKIRGPVLLLAGKDDQIWPSDIMASHILARLRRHHHPYHDVLVAYDDVGHPIPYAYLPTGGRRNDLVFAVGGTQEGTAGAQRDAWPRILKFLDDAAARHPAGVP